MAKKCGRIELNIMETMSRAKGKARELCRTRIMFTLENSKTESFMETEDLRQKMEEAMKVTGRITKCMELDNLVIPMAFFISIQ